MTRSKEERILPLPIGSGRNLPVHFARNEPADRTYFIRQAGQSALACLSDTCKALAMTFSLESMNLSTFKRYFWPTVSSGAALLLGNYASRALSKLQCGSEEYDCIYQLVLGSAILSYSAMQRVSEKQYHSTASFSAAVAAEVTAIASLYRGVFNSSNLLLTDWMTENAVLVANLGISALLVPGGLTFVVQRIQEKLVSNQYAAGAQRSDTSVISAGLTAVANLYFQINHFLIEELKGSSHLFQLGLITNNILTAPIIFQQFRNIPALLADLAPAMIKQLMLQQRKVDADKAYNCTPHQVLVFTAKGSEWKTVPRYQLRSGDLVYCDASIDLSSVQVSGELIALERDVQGQFLPRVQQEKCSVNLQAQNGENVWIDLRSKPGFDSTYEQVELAAIRHGRQAGVLVGDKLNLYASTQFFIQILPEKERICNSDYEKKAVINQIISARQQKTVACSIFASCALALILQRDPSLLPSTTLMLMFTIFQTMIPFSEGFLREAVNTRLMKKLNANLPEHPMETIDALRVVDFCNALGGYYQDKFPKGVAIISDKTGTLTSNHMDVLGLWTHNMPQKVSLDQPELLLPDSRQVLEAFEVFAAAYTVNKKELEPEEFAILQTFEICLQDKNCLQTSLLATNHFQKILRINQNEKVIETFHLGLYRNFGGRFTLVKDGAQAFLVFCGVPRQAGFAKTKLLKHYSAMHTRTQVLSRDWCVARSPLSEKEEAVLLDCFRREDKESIDAFLLSNQELLSRLKHYVTFLINNPVKKAAEHFIKRCKTIQVPVFIATGDTTKSAVNIAKVLCKSQSQHIITIDAEQNSADLLAENYCTAQSTVIFSGLHEDTLTLFLRLLQRKKEALPVIIFAEMSTEGKGKLAHLLKQQGFYLVANGDGTNDVMMMKHADMVIAHCTEDGSFAPGVRSLVDLSDEQLRCLRESNRSFYELFDIHLKDSALIQLFTSLANSQEKILFALTLKIVKMSFELFKSLGAPNIVEMPHQHWYGVGFDLIWLGIAYYEISASTDLPLDNRHIGASDLITYTIGLMLLLAIMLSAMNYLLFSETTNVMSMSVILMVLPLVLRSFFAGFQHVQDKVHPVVIPVQSEEEHAPKPGTIPAYLGTLFRCRARGPAVRMQSWQPDDAVSQQL